MTGVKHGLFEFFQKEMEFGHPKSEAEVKDIIGDQYKNNKYDNLYRDSDKDWMQVIYTDESIKAESIKKISIKNITNPKETNTKLIFNSKDNNYTILLDGVGTTDKFKITDQDNKEIKLVAHIKSLEYLEPSMRFIDTSGTIINWKEHALANYDDDYINTLLAKKVEDSNDASDYLFDETAGIQYEYFCGVNYTTCQGVTYEFGGTLTETRPKLDTHTSVEDYFKFPDVYINNNENRVMESPDIKLDKSWDKLRSGQYKNPDLEASKSFIDRAEYLTGNEFSWFENLKAYHIGGYEEHFYGAKDPEVKIDAEGLGRKMIKLDERDYNLWLWHKGFNIKDTSNSLVTKVYCDVHEYREGKYEGIYFGQCYEYWNHPYTDVFFGLRHTYIYAFSTEVKLAGGLKLALAATATIGFDCDLNVVPGINQLIINKNENYRKLSTSVAKNLIT